MRALYDSLGVLSSAAFVIDGPSFTSSRVAESHDGVHYPLAVYDAAAQILANAMDWLLPPPREDPFVPRELGKMANPSLGFMIVCFVFMGLFCFDAFLGFSYLAAFFGSGLMPSDLCDEAFEEFHERLDRGGSHSYEMSASTAHHHHEHDDDDDQSTLATGQVSGTSSRDRSHRSGRTKRSQTSGRSGRSSASGRSGVSCRSGHSSQSGGSGGSSRGSIDDEIAALLGTTSRRLEMTELGNV